MADSCFSDATAFSGLRGAATDLAAPAGEVGAGARAESQGLLLTLGMFGKQREQ